MRCQKCKVPLGMVEALGRWCLLGHRLKGWLSSSGTGKEWGELWAKLWHEVDSKGGR